MRSTNRELSSSHSECTHISIKFPVHLGSSSSHLVKLAPVLNRFLKRGGNLFHLLRAIQCNGTRPNYSSSRTLHNGARDSEIFHNKSRNNRITGGITRVRSRQDYTNEAAQKEGRRCNQDNCNWAPTSGGYPLRGWKKSMGLPSYRKSATTKVDLDKTNLCDLLVMPEGKITSPRPLFTLFSKINSKRFKLIRPEVLDIRSNLHYPPALASYALRFACLPFTTA